jgi:hypothetical protein
MFSTVFSLLFWFAPMKEDLPAPGEIGLCFLVFLAGPWLVVTGQLLLYLSALRADPPTRSCYSCRLQPVRLAGG